MPLVLGPQSRVHHFRLPRPESWEQAGDVAAVINVGIPEATPEVRLLDQRDHQDVHPQEDQPPHEVRPGKEEQRLAEQNEENPGNHWVADVSVWPAKHELPWWIPRGESSFALGRETTQ